MNIYRYLCFHLYWYRKILISWYISYRDQSIVIRIVSWGSRQYPPLVHTKGHSSTWWPASLHQRGGCYWFTNHRGSERFLPGSVQPQDVCISERHQLWHIPKVQNPPALKTLPPTECKRTSMDGMPTYRCCFEKQQTALIHQLWTSPSLDGTRRKARKKERKSSSVLDASPIASPALLDITCWTAVAAKLG